MTDFARANSGGATHFADKDSLSTGDPDKVILGSEHDTEYNAIAVAVASKYDSADIASEAQAQAETLNTVLITPLRLGQWADNAAGMVGDIQDLADPGEDQLLGWDDSAGAVIGFGAGTGLATSGSHLVLSHLGLQTLTDPGPDRILFWDDTTTQLGWLATGSGISLTGTTLSADASGINHDSLSNFVANEHIDHTSVTLTAGDGLSGGGTIAASRSFAVDSTVVRTTGAQTVGGVKTFSSRPQESGGGGFLSYGSATYEGGEITVSTSDPSGTPGDGDLWFKYTA